MFDFDTEQLFKDPRQELKIGTATESYNKFFNRRYNQGRKDGFKKGYEKGNTDGYNKGMNEWAIWVYCYNCWKSIFIKPNSHNHKEVIEEMRGRLKHDQCPQE